jgi:hypothetical protein
VNGSGPQFASVVPGAPFMNTIPFQVSRNQARLSGSIPLLSSLLWTRVLGRALLATAPRTVNSGTSVETRCAAPISHGVGMVGNPSLNPLRKSSP